MLGIFRHIRRKLMEQNKIRTYLLYAVGEILLVVIGILIALQVNNWNEERIIQNQMHDYYQEINEEILENISQSEYITANTILSEKITKSLQLIEKADPDSLKKLEDTIGAVGTAYTSTFALPVTEEFISNGYINNVQSDSLKVALRSLRINMERLEKINRYIVDQYQSEIEPFFHPIINYSGVVLERNRNDIYVGGPETDFSSLANNMEAWNIINFKLEITNANLRNLQEAVNSMKQLTRMLEKAIDQ